MTSPNVFNAIVAINLEGKYDSCGPDELGTKRLATRDLLQKYGNLARYRFAEGRSFHLKWSAFSPWSAVPACLTEILSSLLDHLSLEMLHTSFILPCPDVRKHFQDNYVVGPAVFTRACNQTATFGYQDGTAGLLLVGSQITRRDG
jgi:hypothetical protein